MPPFEPFRFQIEEVFTIFRDPGGHYHHFTALTGWLLEGVVRLHQPVAIPGREGQRIVSHVVHLETRHRAIEELSAGHKEMAAVLIWKPAPLVEDVALGVAEWFQGEPPFDRLELLRSQPTVFLHKIPETGKLCPECIGNIRNSSDAMVVLTELMTSSDHVIAELAAEVLQLFRK
jgi:hypothetical protein